MPEKEKPGEPDTVRVVDRRRFTSAGERRPDVEAPPEPPPEPPTLQAPASPPAPPASQAPPAGESEAARTARQAYDHQRGPQDFKVDFEGLIMSLSTSAMLQLGLIEDPARGRAPADLEAARHTIDTLGLIQEKTRGNLTAHEVQLLDQVLYELRLAFVHVGNQPPAAPRGV